MSSLMANAPPIQKPGLLDNPMLQGLLSAYLGAIGSPKSKGLGGALSAGGLSGLSAYNQAKTAQLQPYITAATLGKDIAQTKEANAIGDWRSAQAAQTRAIGEQNSRKAQALRDAARNNPDPVAQQGLSWAAEFIQGDTTKSYTPEDIEKVITDRTTQAKNMAETDLAQKRAAGEEYTTEHVLPATVSEKTATAGAEQQRALTTEAQRTQLLPAQVAHEQASTLADNVRAAAAGPARAEAMAKFEDTVGKQYDAEHMAISGYKFFKTPGYLKGRTDAIEKAKSDFGVTDKPTMPTSTTAPHIDAHVNDMFSKIPKGASPYIFGDGRHGYQMPGQAPVPLE